MHDPGGKVRLTLQPGVQGAAEFSACGQYRHWLSRYWGEGPFVDYALWIGLNPSTAEALCDDPTIRREIEFTRRQRLTGYCKVNMFDYRSTNPNGLLARGVYPCSAENYETIAHLANGGRARLIIAAWGVVPAALKHYLPYLLQILPSPIYCLGTTKDSSPRHPLYVRADTQLVEWVPPKSTK